MLQLLTTRLQADMATAQSVAIDIECLIGAMLKCVLSEDTLLKAMSHEALGAREIYSWRAMIRTYEETWRRLTERNVHAPISRDLPLTDRCRIFRSYPSNTLDSSSLLELTDVSFQKTMLDEPMRYKELAGTGFNSELAERILRVFRHVGRAMVVSELEEGCGSDARSQILWHLLWLMKQGYLRVHRAAEGCSLPAFSRAPLRATN